MNYKFDALRYCRNNMGRLHLPDGSDPMERIADELQRAMELREAVAWERECRAIEAWMNTRPWSKGDAEIWASLAAARAEVDRLIGGE